MLFTRGLKRHQLFKKKKKKKPKYRDGKETTVDHLYWEQYFKENPNILIERRMANVKNAPEGTRPMSARRVYDTLTTGDKR